MQLKGLYSNTKFRWLIVSLFVVAVFSTLSFFSIHMPLWFELPLLLTMIAVFGRKVFISGAKSLLKFNFANINLLMAIATIGALYLRQFEEAVIIIVLFALGDTLEGFGIRRSKEALKSLLDRVPKTAEIKGRAEPVLIEQIKLDEVVIVRPGGHIPIDGEVTAGTSLVDEAAITGESIPKDKHPGDLVYAGTANGTGYLEVRVTKLAKDTTLAKIVELTYRSSEKKSVSHKFIEKFAKIYTPLVLLTAISLVVIPVLIFRLPFEKWFVQSLSLLIISCPCALVISTPIAIFSAIGNATKKGVVIKGGRFLEEMGKVRAIAFDKTRTLTRGEPAVADIVPLNGFGEDDVIACAAGMEAFSEHPIAKSILKKAEEKGVDIHEFMNFQAIPGKGLKGECTVCDSHHCMGNVKFVSEEHDVSDEVMEKILEFEKQGKTTIVMSDNNNVKGVISVTDEIREESWPLIKGLAALNIVPVILTGDNESSAAYVAAELGIETVRATLLPHEKVDELMKLIEKYGHVAMVGDGVNDAPALATASVGIAMGAIGSDVAIENADIALMNDKLDMVTYLIALGRKCVEKIRFNVILAVAVKFLFLSLAIAGKSNLALAIFADVGVTILVILNSLRLYDFKEV